MIKHSLHFLGKFHKSHGCGNHSSEKEQPTRCFLESKGCRDHRIPKRTLRTRSPVSSLVSHLFCDTVFSATDSVYSLWLSHNETEAEILSYEGSTLERCRQSWVSDFILFCFYCYPLLGGRYFFDQRILRNFRSAGCWQLKGQTHNQLHS